MSMPLIILLLTAILAIIVLPIRDRWEIAAAIAFIGVLLIGSFSLLASLEEPFVFLGISLKWSSTWQILGRSLSLDEGNRAAVAFLYFAGAIIFGGAWITKPNRAFIFVGVVSIGVVAASFMIQPFLFAAIFLEMAAMGAVLILSTRQSSTQSGGVRLLILYTVGMLAILMAGWILESRGVTTATPDLANRATVMLALGFAVLMAVPPFHLWLPRAAQESNPYALAFVAILLQSAGIFYLLRFLDSFIWLRESEALFSGIRVVSIIMIVLSSLWALAQSSLAKIMAYALLSDFGVTLLAISTNLPEGFQLALGMTGVRVISLAVLGIGLAVLPANENDENEEKGYLGAAYRYPLSAIAIVAGLLSLAGFPLFAGFPGRWSLITMIAATNMTAAIAVIISLACIGTLALRWTRIFLRADLSDKPVSTPFMERVFMICGIVFCLLLGLFPQLSYPWVVEAVAGMTQLFP